MLSLSVVIITKNEDETISGCLESVSFAQEILVLDSGSTDHTIQLCRNFGATVISTDWPGDGPQRNRGIALAKSDWVLCLDADERVSPALAQELTSILNQTKMNGFYIPFQSHYLGQYLRFGDWYKEKHLRLFRKGYGQYSESAVYGAQAAHCRPQVVGTIGTLQHPILHYPFRSLDTVLEKINRYSTGSALIRLEQGQTSSFYKALFHGLWTFIRGYCLKLGFLDGQRGFMLALSNAEGCYYRYLKMCYKNTSKYQP